MTCIVGYVDSKGVYIGGDSLGISDDFSKEVRTDAKVFKKGSMIFGFTSSFRMGQLIRYCLEIPKHENMSNEEYLCCDFMDAVMKCFKEKNFATVDDNVISGGEFLLGYKRQLFCISEDFQVGICATKYQAIGAGSPYSLGALHALEKIKLTPENRIKKALAAATEHCAAVSPPYKIVSIKNK